MTLDHKPTRRDFADFVYDCYSLPANQFRYWKEEPGRFTMNRAENNDGDADEAVVTTSPTTTSSSSASRLEHRSFRGNGTCGPRRGYSRRVPGGKPPWPRTFSAARPRRTSRSRATRPCGATSTSWLVVATPRVRYATSGHATRPRSRSGADRSNVPEGNVPELKIPDKTGPHLYEIGNSDWDAAVRWVNNLATNVDYTRKVHGEAVLSPAEVAKWTDFWRRWLLFGRKVETVKTQMRDEGLAAKVLSVTSPLLWASRRLYATAQGSLALMSTENKRELDRLLHEAWGLYQEFRRLGMSQVAVPYMGDLVVLLRTLPAEVTLPEMVARLRAAAQVGARLLDQNTAWWQWRKRDDTRGLTRADRRRVEARRRPRGPSRRPTRAPAPATAAPRSTPRSSAPSPRSTSRLPASTGSRRPRPRRQGRGCRRGQTRPRAVRVDDRLAPRVGWCWIPGYTLVDEGQNSSCC